MDKGLLSIIIPVYNMEKYLERCLESVINQSYKNIEIIIINDGSTDNSHQIIKNYSAKYNNINYINLQNNRGLGNARNCGLDSAKGEYVTFIDSDDWIDSNFYMTIINNIKKYNLDIAVAGIVNEYDDRKAYTYRYKYPFDNQITGKFALNLLIKSTNQDIYITPIVNNKVYKRTLIESLHLRFIENNYNEDDIFSFLLIREARKIGVVKDTYYHYYQRSSSITGYYKQKHIDDLIDAYTYLFDIKDIDRSDPYTIKYFERNLTFVFDLLFRTNLSVCEMRKQVAYIFNKVNELYSIEELLQLVDISRLKLLLGIGL